MSKEIPQIALKKRIKDNVEGFEVLDLQKLLKSTKPAHHSPFKLHRLTFYVILVNLGGALKHRIDFQTIEIPKGHCIVLTPGVTHAFIKNQDYQGKLMVFNEDFLYANTHSKSMNDIRHILSMMKTHQCYDYSSRLSKLQEFIETELKEINDLFSNNVIGGYITAFLLDMLRQNVGNRVSEKDTLSSQYFFRFKTLLFQNYHLNRNADFYSNELGITYKHLNNIIKLFSGKTAKTFIADHVILEAKRLLSTSEKSIKEIGFNCGFEEPTNFTKFFKTRTQMTPKNFRDKYQG